MFTKNFYDILLHENHGLQNSPWGSETLSGHWPKRFGRLKLCTHDQDLCIRKFCIYANFAYVSKSIFYFAFTWLLSINRICRKLKFYSIKVIVNSLNSGHA